MAGGAQSVEHRPASGRLVERLQHRGLDRHGAGDARHRHRWLGAQSRHLLRCHRHEADLRRDQPRRRLSPRLLARPCRPDHADGRGQRHPLSGHRRPRSRRSGQRAPRACRLRRRHQARHQGPQDRRHRPFLRRGSRARPAIRHCHQWRDRGAEKARRRGEAGTPLAARAVDGLRPRHPLRGGLRDPRARPAGAAAGLCRDHPPPHARRRLHRGVRIRQGAAAAHGAVRRVSRHAARGRRPHHAVEF